MSLRERGISTSLVLPQRSHFFILVFPIFQWHNLYHNCCSSPQPFCVLQCETLNHHIMLPLINVGSLRFGRSWMQRLPKTHGKSMQTAASWPYTMEQHDHHPKPRLMDPSQAVPVLEWSSWQGQQWKAEVPGNTSSLLSDHRWSPRTHIMNINWAGGHNSTMVK